MTHNLGMVPYRVPGSGICPPDFKPPTESSQLTTAPSNPKKRRKTSNTSTNQTTSQPPPLPQDLLPPPLTGYGDTIVASNPFDDTPLTNTSMSHSSLGHMGMHGSGISSNMHHHISVGSTMRGMNPLGMNNMGPMSGIGPIGSGMQCGGPIPPHVNNRGAMSPMGNMQGTSMGGMSPMNNMGPSLSPMGPMAGMSPIGGPPNSHIGINSMGPSGRNSIGSPMSTGSIGSPMNSLPMGSPMGNAMGSPLGVGSGPVTHINNGQMGPPMHSPLGNNNMSGSRMNVSNGTLSQVSGPMTHQMSPLGGTCSNNPMTSSPAQMTTTNNMNSMVGGMGGHSPISNQNVSMTQGGSIGANTAHSVNNPITNISHGISMGPGHMVQMSHMNAGGGTGGSSINGPPNSLSNMFGPKPMPVNAGKMYPPGQPMVFNPQNPNAPPIYPCGLCHKEVNDNDEALFCEPGCKFFFHRTCSGMTETAFQMISKEIYAEWCCDKCLSSMPIPLVKFKC